MKLDVASGPTSWGVDYADASANPPWADVLDGVAAAGYTWLELGPTGYLPEDAQTLRAELDSRGLRASGTFLFEPFHDSAQVTRILAAAERTCRFVTAAGGRLLVLIDHLAPQRAGIAGNAAQAARLFPEELAAALRVMEEVARLAKSSRLRAVLHPHAGTFFEFEDEIEAAMAGLDPELVGLCVDTGHSLYAGIDPASLVRKYGERVEHVHLKDTDVAVRERCVASGAGFFAAVEAGIFRPVGQGSVDFVAFGEALAEVLYSGVATVEQDRDATRPGDPVADARESLDYLRSIGLASAGERSAA